MIKSSKNLYLAFFLTSNPVRRYFGERKRLENSFVGQQYIEIGNKCSPFLKNR